MLLAAPLSRHRSDALDLLRFLCALWVLFAHVLPWANFVAPGSVPAPLLWLAGALVRVFQLGSGTHPAVLIFIVLSGYCIHRGGFRGDPRTGLQTYAIRRTFRILPVYLLAIAAGVAAWSYSRTVDATLTQQLSGTVSISPAAVFLRTIGLSAFVPPLNARTYAGNAPLHTVMVEIWLYVAYPAGLWLMLRCGEARIYAGLGAMWIVGALISDGLGWANWWHNGSLFGFLPYWWIGAYCVGARLDKRVAIVAAVAWLLCTVVAPQHLLLMELHKASLAVLAGMSIAALDRQRAHVPGLFAWFGKAGYSLYAFHAPVAYTLLIMGWHWLAVITTAIVVGVVSFVTYESPLNQFGRQLASRAVSNAAPAE